MWRFYRNGCERLLTLPHESSPVCVSGFIGADTRQAVYFCWLSSTPTKDLLCLRPIMRGRRDVFSRLLGESFSSRCEIRRLR